MTKYGHDKELNFILAPDEYMRSEWNKNQSDDAQTYFLRSPLCCLVGVDLTSTLPFFDIIMSECTKIVMEMRVLLSKWGVNHFHTISHLRGFDLQIFMFSYKNCETPDNFSKKNSYFEIQIYEIWLKSFTKINENPCTTTSFPSHAFLGTFWNPHA